jgi:uncharacterized membrane protein
LVFAGTFLLCLMSPIWNRALGRAKLFVLPTLLLVVGGIIGLEWMQQEGDLIIARFVDTDYQTGHGRLASLTYLFEHVYDPLWWVPRGNAEFAEQYGGGNVPHSNITAMFLEGGILGLYMWIVVFLLPVLKLAGMFFRKQLDPLATMILISGFSMLVVQLSLNVPFFKQPWLWAGAVVGALYRSRTQLAETRHASAVERVRAPKVASRMLPENPGERP